MAKQVYKSRIDWWCWLSILFIIGVAVALAIDTTWCVVLPVCGFSILCIGLIEGCWYEIDGNQLVVYQFFRPTPFPIDKISEVKKNYWLLGYGWYVKQKSVN